MGFRGMNKVLLGIIIPLLSLSYQEEAVSYEGERPEFDIKEFGYVFDKLQELIDEVQALKEGILPHQITQAEWQAIWFPEEVDLEAQQSTHQSIYSNSDRSSED
jgi:hypothetical protein